MKLISRCFPSGALAYADIDHAVRMVAKLFEKTPYIPILPKIAPDENILKRTLDNIPGIIVDGKKVLIQPGNEKYKQALADLEKACTNPTKELLEPYAIQSVFMEKFEQLIHKFKSTEACVNLLGPFTLSQILSNAAEEKIIADKSFKKLFIQAVCAKALWAIYKIKEISNSTIPIIVLEEPMLGQLGSLKRDNDDITVDFVTSMLAKVVEKIQPTGALIAVQCYDKCDWKIPINAGIDIISFDAYNNPNNLCIIPDSVLEFLERGGKINWAIVPTINENTVKNLNLDLLEKRFIKTMEGLVTAGIPRPLVYNSALVSLQGDVDKLPLVFSEKALILATQLAKRIPVVKKG